MRVLPDDLCFCGHPRKEHTASIFNHLTCTQCKCDSFKARNTTPYTFSVASDIARNKGTYQVDIPKESCRGCVFEKIAHKDCSLCRRGGLGDLYLSPVQACYDATAQLDDTVTIATIRDIADKFGCQLTISFKKGDTNET
jgi:hypothetical protein